MSTPDPLQIVAPDALSGLAQVPDASVQVALTYRQGKKGTTNAPDGSNGRFAAGGKGYGESLRQQPEFFKHDIPGVRHQSESFEFFPSSLSFWFVNVSTPLIDWYATRQRTGWPGPVPLFPSATRLEGWHVHPSRCRRRPFSH